ncbi:MAG: DUF3352 domain-containing protein [Actinomycetota bacterium]|nr:DUF3352 domain-containing protein [Actinomycetota bacterium]
MTARRRSSRPFLAFYLVALALFLSACGGGGGSSSSGSASSAPSGADEASAAALAFISVNTDLSSGQWDAVNKLLAKFPGKDKLLADMRQSFEADSGVSWEQDVKPALGPEIDIVVLDAQGATVGLTQPKDEAKFDALVAKAKAQDGNLVTEKVGDWTVISDKQASIDLFKQGSSGSKLADDETFKTATGTLADEALAKVYVNGAQAKQAAQNNASGVSVGDFEWAAAELVAQDEGVKLDGTIKGQPLGSVNQPASYTPKLLADVPSGALMVLDFKGGKQNLDQLNNPGLGQLQGFLQVAKGLTPIFENETVAFVAPGTPFPEVTIVAEPENPQLAVASMTQLATQLGALAGGVTPRQTQIEGKPVTELNFGQFAVLYGVVDGKLVVSSSRAAISGRSGGSLEDDAVFKDAKAAAGMPDSVGGFLYVNLKAGIPVLESFAQVAGSALPPQVSENISPLESFIAFGSGDSSETKFGSFLRIE